MLAVVLAASMALPLASCRDSDALVEKIIGDPYEYETDESLDPVAVENPEASPTDHTSQNEEDEAEREDEQTESDPEYSPDDATVEDEASSTEQSDLPASDAAAISGDNASDSESGTLGEASDDGESGGQDVVSDGDGSSTTKGQTIVVNSSSSSSNDPQADDGSEDSGGESNNGGSAWNPGTSSGSGSGGGSSGNTYSEGDVTSGRLPQADSIAAAGPYATIVQALGGQGALAACNADWYDSLSDEAFNYKQELQDTSKISAWGDGTSMNEETFQAIVNSGADVVITSSTYGGVTTDDWAERFNEAGISVVELPVLGIVNAQDDDITTVVQAIGTMLSEADIQYNASEAADKWVSLHDEALSNVLSANGGYTTYLIDGSSSDILFDGNGAVFGNASTASHVTNTSANRYYTTTIYSWASSSSQTVNGHTYPFDRMRSIVYDSRTCVWPYEGSWDTPGDETSYTRYFTIDTSDGFGYTPSVTEDLGGTCGLFDYYYQHAGIIDTQVRYRNAYTNNPAVYASSRAVEGQYTIWTYQNGATTLVTVGGSSFPGFVIRNDDEIIDSIQSSASVASPASLTVGTYNVGQNYCLFVMPDGIDGYSWLDGTFESFLMAPWAYCMFQNGQNLDACDSYVNEFYETFYRCGGDAIEDDGYGRVETIQCNRASQ